MAILMIFGEGMHGLLPPIEVVKGSRFNIDPTNPKEVDSFLEAQMEKDGKELSDLETEVIPAPFIEVKKLLKC